MNAGKSILRRKALAIGAAAAALPLVHVRGAAAAGKLSVGFLTQWVPAGEGILRKQVEAWAANNKVAATADFIASAGNEYCFQKQPMDQVLAWAQNEIEGFTR